MTSDREGEERIIPNTNRRLQRTRSRRKLFGVRRQQIFLEHLAATCNVTASAAAADICVGSVYRERMRNPLFREAWGAALEQGYARLEATLLEQVAGGGGLAVRGDKIVDGPEAPHRIDWDKAMDLLRQHRLASPGPGRAGAGRRGGHEVRRLGPDELRARVIRKLKAIGIKIEE
jgi:hypothetical protein